VVAQDRVRAVGCFQAGDLGPAQGHLDRGDCVLQVAQPGRPDDRCGHGGLAEQPGKRDLRRGQAALGGDRADHVDDVEVVVVQLVGERVGAGPDGPLLAASLAVAGQQPARQRAPRMQPTPWSRQSGIIYRSSSR
jgi:hypothetical protein